MKSLKIIFLIAALIFLSACTRYEYTEMANPASVYCEEQGGEVRMEENLSGQYGICVLPNGVECEEWAYYRGECE